MNLQSVSQGLARQRKSKSVLSPAENLPGPHKTTNKSPTPRTLFSQSSETASTAKKSTKPEAKSKGSGSFKGSFKGVFFKGLLAGGPTSLFSSAPSALPGSQPAASQSELKAPLDVFFFFLIGGLEFGFRV